MTETSSQIKSESTPTKEGIIAERKAWEQVKAHAQLRIENCDKALEALEATQNLTPETPKQAPIPPQVAELRKATDLKVIEEVTRYIIKPVSWLGPDRFGEVSELVKKANGLWVKSGKDSHWLIKK